MNNKIPVLLAEYERQTKSASAEKSSLAHAARRFETAAEAEKTFERLKQKLFRINNWNNVSGVSSYELFDAGGNSQPDPIARATVGDFIKITLPGSGKSDWVRVVRIHETPTTTPAEEVVLTVQPSSDPTDQDGSGRGDKTSHFFTDESTNNFCLERRQNELNFYVVGLGEKANTRDTESFLESIRNFATANIGHYFGIQKGEWTTFCENFLEIKKEEA